MGKLAFGEGSTGSTGGKPRGSSGRGGGKSWAGRGTPRNEASYGTAAGLLAATGGRGRGRGGSVRGRGGRGGPLGATRPKRPCVFCQEEHYDDKCSKYPDARSRRQRLQSLGNCYSCLEPGHERWKCPNPPVCYHCERAHHSSLCSEKFKPTGPIKKDERPADAMVALGSSVLVAQSEVHPVRNRMAVLSLATAYAKGSNGKFLVRILLDNAATRCYGRIATLDKVGARRLQPEMVALSGIGAKGRTPKQYSCYALTLLDQNGESFPVVLNGLASITAPVGKPVVDPSRYPQLRQVKLAQPLSSEGEEVVLDVILGLDYYYEIVGPKTIPLDKGLVLVETLFGYVVSGYVQQDLPARDNLGDPTLLVISEKQAHVRAEGGPGQAVGPRSDGYDGPPYQNGGRARTA